MNAETFSVPLDGFSRLPVVRQVGILVGLAMSVALGVSIALWSWEPSYAPLYTRMSDMDVSEVATALNGMGIKYKLDAATGSILVPNEDVYNARLKLASQGLPNVTGSDPGDKQLEYTRQVEDTYMRRVLDIVTPLVGAGGVRTQVVADIDFTVTEETAELYNPDGTAVRSEQQSENASSESGLKGVRGALTNQLPDAGAMEGRTQQNEIKPLSRSSATQNLEVYRTVRHVRQVPGELRKLSVAVVVDYRDTVDEAGKVTREPLSEEELALLTSLVRDAVGYDKARGDTVSVINASFLKKQAQSSDLPSKPIWENPQLWNMGKILFGVLGVLLLIFGVLRPTMKGLSAGPVRFTDAGEGMATLPLGLAAEGSAFSSGDEPLSLIHKGPVQHEQKLKHAREVAKEDPKQVAQIVKTWLAADE
jgi:flagellar M-ring protein FliF